MVRVAFDATPLVGEPTGIGVFVRGAVGELAGRDGLCLRAFALTWRGRRDWAGVLPAGVARVRLPMAATPLLQIWARVDEPVVEWWTGPVDVVHGTNFVVPPAARAAEVVSVYDLTAVRFPQLCLPATLRYPVLVRRAVRRGAWVHTISGAMAEEITELLGAPADRIRIVAPGVGPSLGAGGGERGGGAGGGAVAAGRGGGAGGGAGGAGRGGGAGGGAGGAGIGAGRRYVLAIGRAEPRKDLPLLVRAFDAVAAEHPDLDLVLAGPAGWGDDALQAAVAAAHHHARIRRVGWVSEGQKAELLRRAAVFAYPSVYEGFGIPPLEAMAAGVPVVATAAGGIPEAVGGAALLVPVGDCDGLAAALATLLGDEQARDRLVASGRQRVAMFSWRRCADGLESLYRDAASSRT